MLVPLAWVRQVSRRAAGWGWGKNRPPREDQCLALSVIAPLDMEPDIEPVMDPLAAAFFLAGLAFLS